MGVTRWGWTALATGAACLTASCGSVPEAAPQTSRPPWPAAPAGAISPRLQQGGVAIAPAQDPSQDQLGGAAALLIEAPSFVVMAALERPHAYWHVLPRVLAIEEQPSDDEDQALRITHGTGPFRGSYVLRVRREWGDDGRHVIRFWVDTRYPRVVDDAWGYFEMRPVGTERTLLTYQVRARLQPGLVRALFARGIQEGLMIVPERARLYVRWCQDQSEAEGPRDASDPAP